MTGSVFYTIHNLLHSMSHRKTIVYIHGAYMLNQNQQIEVYMTGWCFIWVGFSFVSVCAFVQIIF